MKSPGKSRTICSKTTRKRYNTIANKNLIEQNTLEHETAIKCQRKTEQSVGNGIELKSTDVNQWKTNHWQKKKLNIFHPLEIVSPRSNVNGAAISMQQTKWIWPTRVGNFPYINSFVIDKCKHRSDNSHLIRLHSSVNEFHVRFKMYGDIGPFDGYQSASLLTFSLLNQFIYSFNISVF